MSKVLIAEDDTMIADMCEEALLASDYEVCGIDRTVTSYRQRAADITAKLDGLSASDRATALLQQYALNQLADVEEWISIKPRIPSKYDCNLLPRAALAPAS